MSTLTHSLGKLTKLIVNTRKLIEDDYYNLNHSSSSIVLSTRNTISNTIRNTKSFHIFAELKFSSPTRTFEQESTVKNAKDRLESLVSAGISGLSILTEPNYFKGSLQYLLEASRTFPQLPILMKDFFLDTVQIDAANYLGASTILLIAKILSKKKTNDLIEYAHNSNLEVLFEVNNSEEMEWALKTDTDIIGINNRDLTTFEMDLATTERLMSLHYEIDRPILSLSGIHTREDALRMKKVGADGILVGTALSEASDPNYVINELKGV